MSVTFNSSNDIGHLSGTYSGGKWAVVGQNPEGDEWESWGDHLNDLEYFYPEQLEELENKIRSLGFDDPENCDCVPYFGAGETVQDEDKWFGYAHSAIPSDSELGSVLLQFEGNLPTAEEVDSIQTKLGELADFEYSDEEIDSSKEKLLKEAYSLGIISSKELKAGNLIASKADFTTDGTDYYKTPEGTYPITDGINNELLGYYDPKKQALCLFKGDYTLISAEDAGEDYENIDSLVKEFVPESAKDHGTVWERYDGGEYIWWRFDDVTETPMSEEEFKSRFVTAEDSRYEGRVGGTYTNDGYGWWNDYPGTGWIDICQQAE